MVDGVFFCFFASKGLKVRRGTAMVDRTWLPSLIDRLKREAALAQQLLGAREW